MSTICLLTFPLVTSTYSVTVTLEDIDIYNKGLTENHYVENVSLDFLIQYFPAKILNYIT